MSILNIAPLNIGNVGNAPTQYMINTSDTLATVTSSGYLNVSDSIFSFSTNDFAWITTTDSGTQPCQITVTNGIVTLSVYSISSVTLIGDPSHGLTVSQSPVGTWTISLSQDLRSTGYPTFANLNITGLSGFSNATDALVLSNTSTGELSYLTPSATTPLYLSNNLSGSPKWDTVSASSISGVLTVPHGGTGNSSFTPYSLIFGGTTSTSALQTLPSLGNALEVLTSNGPNVLPSFQNVSLDVNVDGITIVDSPYSFPYYTSDNISLAGVGGFAYEIGTNCYISICHNGSNTFSTFSLNTSTNEWVYLNSTTAGNHCSRYVVFEDPNNSTYYFVCTNTSDGTISTFSWSGSAWVSIGSDVSLGYSSPVGINSFIIQNTCYLLVQCTNEIVLLKFNETAFSVVTSVSLTSASVITSFVLSNIGYFFVCAGATINSYSTNGTTITTLQTGVSISSSASNLISYYLAPYFLISVCCTSASVVDNFEFNTSSLTLSTFGSNLPSLGIQLNSCAFYNYNGNDFLSLLNFGSQTLVTYIYNSGIYELYTSSAYNITYPAVNLSVFSNGTNTYYSFSFNEGTYNSVFLGLIIPPALTVQQINATNLPPNTSFFPIGSDSSGQGPAYPIVTNDYYYNGNISSIVTNNEALAVTIITAAAGTTSILSNSTRYQIVQGSTTQTIQLPTPNSNFLGLCFEIFNESTGAVTVNVSGGGLLQTLPTNTKTKVVCQLTSGSTTASWIWDYNTINGNNAPVISLANVVSQTLPITANVIPNANITYTGTIGGTNFGQITYTNPVSNTASVSGPVMTLTQYGVALSSLTTINYGNVQQILQPVSGTYSSLTSISAPNAIYAQLAIIYAPLLSTISLPSATYLDMTSTAGIFDSLTSFSLPNVTEINTFGNSFPVLTSLSIPSLTTINGSFSPAMASLTSLSLNSLTEAFIFSISASNASLTSLSLSSLAILSSYTGASTIAAPNLTSLSLPALTNIVGGITITLPLCTSFSIPVLTTVGNSYSESGAATVGLTITLASLISFSLPDLVASYPGITLNLPAATTISMPSLTTVGSGLNFGTATACTTLTLTDLTTVNGPITGSFPALSNSAFYTAFSGLTTINTTSAGMTLSLPLVTSFSFPNLITGAFYTGLSLPICTSISFPVMTNNPFEFVINSAPMVTSFSAPDLVTTGNMTLTFPLLASFSLPSLTTATNGITLALASCISLSMPVLATCTGSVTITAPLLYLSLPDLVTVTGSVVLSSTVCGSISLPNLVTGGISLTCPALPSLSLPSLVTANGITLVTVALESISCPSVTLTSALALGTLSACKSLSFPVLAGCGTVAAGGNGAFSLTAPLLTTVSFPDLAYIYNGMTLSCSLCTSFSMPVLSTIQGAVSTITLPVLTTFALPDLLNTTGLTLSLSACTSFSMPVLATCSNTLSITAPVLTTFALPDFVNGSTVTLSLAACTSFSMPVFANDVGITTIGAAVLTTFALPDLTFTNGLSLTLAACTSFSIPVLAVCAGAMSVAAASLTTFSLPDLTAVGGACTFTMATCTSFSLANLSVIGGAVSWTLNTLTTISLPALTVVAGAFSITGPDVTTFSFNSGLVSIGGNVTMSGMALNSTSVNGILVSLAALNGTGGTVSYNNFTINVSGGTSAAPSGAGLTAITTLTARGCTVTHN